MITINLRDFYPWCKEDIFVEITEEMLETMKAADRQQEAYRRRTYRYKAQYSLDCHDGIENDALYLSLPLILVEKSTKENGIKVWGHTFLNKWYSFCVKECPRRIQQT